MKMFKISLCFFCFTWLGCSSHDCGNLTDPVNGVVTYSSGTTFQSNATFTCDTGYSLDGNPTRTCQANSTWSDSDPTCAINKCGNLSNPINGFVTYTNGTNYQSIAKFSCATRYSVVGDPTRTCQANKTWSGSDPVCEINGEELSEGTPDRTTVCAGTPLRGSCPSGTVIAVKYIQYGTKATCAPANCCDYDINDCLIDYTDTAQQAACSGREVCDEITIAQADISSCGPPYPVPGLNNYLTMEYYCIPVSRISSIVSSSLSQTGNLLYQQNADYPNPVRASLRNVFCSVEVRSCSSQISVYFLHFELSDGATCTDTQNLKIVDNGSTQTYTCSNNTGYEIALKTTSSSNYITTVLENPAGIYGGKIWLGFKATDSTAPLQIVCPAKSQVSCKDCSLLVSPTDGSISFSDSTTYQSVATFSCNTGYSLEGSPTRECQINGTWSNVNPSCIINDCGNLTDPDNGGVTYSNGTTYQSTARFSCVTGYSLVGDPTRTCQANSTWSYSDPKCEINKCEHLANPLSGFVKYTNGTKYQSIATFGCGTGYSVAGDPTRTCQANKTWTGSNPACEINDCGSLNDPLEGSVTYSSGTTFQSVATFSCATGFMLHGVSTRICQANKLWSDTDPICVVSASQIIGICIGSSAAITFLMLLLYLLFQHLLLRRCARSLKMPIKAGPEDGYILNSIAESHNPITTEAESVAFYTDLKPPEERDNQDYTTINP